LIVFLHLHLGTAMYPDYYLNKLYQISLVVTLRAGLPDAQGVFLLLFSGTKISGCARFAHHPNGWENP